MRTDVTTNEHGSPNLVEGNLAVARDQGRIAENEVECWRQFYASAGYEKATRALLSRPVSARAARGQRVSFSEAAYQDFARRTGVIKPWEDGPAYVRSIV